MLYRETVMRSFIESGEQQRQLLLDQEDNSSGFISPSSSMRRKDQTRNLTTPVQVIVSAFGLPSAPPLSSAWPLSLTNKRACTYPIRPCLHAHAHVCTHVPCHASLSFSASLLTCMCTCTHAHTLPLCLSVCLSLLSLSLSGSCLPMLHPLSANSCPPCLIDLCLCT